MQVPIVTREMTQRMLSVTAAPVTKPLLSVKQLNTTGHRVIFDSDGSFIMNNITGETNALREDDGNYMLDVWVPPNPSFGRQP